MYFFVSLHVLRLIFKCLVDCHVRIINVRIKDSAVFETASTRGTLCSNPMSL